MQSSDLYAFMDAFAKVMNYDIFTLMPLGVVCETFNKWLIDNDIHYVNLVDRDYFTRVGISEVISIHGIPAGYIRNYFYDRYIYYMVKGILMDMEISTKKIIKTEHKIRKIFVLRSFKKNCKRYRISLRISSDVELLMYDVLKEIDYDIVRRSGFDRNRILDTYRLIDSW